MSDQNEEIVDAEQRGQREQHRVAPKYAHARWDEILDAEGQPIFGHNVLYSRAEVFAKRYCAFLKNDRFRCSMRLGPNERQLCGEHYQQWREKLPKRDSNRHNQRLHNKPATPIKDDAGKIKIGKPTTNMLKTATEPVSLTGDKAPEYTVCEPNENAAALAEAAHAKSAQENKNAAQSEGHRQQRQRKQREHARNKRQRLVPRPAQHGVESNTPQQYLQQHDQMVMFINQLIAQVQHLTRAYEQERAQRMQLESQLVSLQNRRQSADARATQRVSVGQAATRPPMHTFHSVMQQPAVSYGYAPYFVPSLHGSGTVAPINTSNWSMNTAPTSNYNSNGLGSAGVPSSSLSQTNAAMIVSGEASGTTRAAARSFASVVAQTTS